MFRTKYDPATGTSATNPREQVNSATSFLDASTIYGSDLERCNMLRSFAGGRMKTSEGNLPPRGENGESFLVGDARGSENPGLTVLHVLFLREHNRVADELAMSHPDWSDEILFQEARKRVIAVVQVITTKEYMPSIF
eukprot:TRINITY_DN13859_c0_g1_i1.p1 TRINITY_DN13859_c0_g1~~TRINITY_DN13859_c0_g1_i1.p1  ORF type:complete len:138 (+),score=26.04 TRINITY_DN13859_c0_g1_i1:443-856(+)